MPKSLLRSIALLAAGAAIPTALMTVQTARAAESTAQDNDTYKQLDQFMNVFQKVRADYVDKTTDKNLIKGAIDGMLASLDPHSSYMDAHDFQQMKLTTDGNYGGLGLTVQAEDGVVKVVTPTEDTPAWRAGIKSGDYITHIGGKLIYGSTLDEAVDQMRGDPGTKITLTIVRPGRDKPFNVTLTRENIVIKPVKWQVKDNIGIININSFSKQTGADTRAAIAGIDKQLGHKPTGYIVDLRDDPGGLLDQAIETADAFLDHGEIVSQRGREKDDIERYYAKPGDDAHGLPIIVLVNAGSASAAEIVAGALQDQRRALVMGERSFGKGSVQTLLPLTDDTALRLTTARYFTPSGRVGAGRRHPPGCRRAAAFGPGLQGSAQIPRGRSAPPPDQRGQGGRQRAGGGQQDRSALLRHRRQPQEAGRQRLPAELRAPDDDAPRRPDRRHPRRDRAAADGDRNRLAQLIARR